MEWMGFSFGFWQRKGSTDDDDGDGCDDGNGGSRNFHYYCYSNIVVVSLFRVFFFLFYFPSLFYSLASTFWRGGRDENSLFFIESCVMDEN